MTDWLAHLLRRPCPAPVTGHAYVPATHPGWGGCRGCIWLALPQADRCFRPARCHRGAAPGS